MIADGARRSARAAASKTMAEGELVQVDAGSRGRASSARRARSSHETPRRGVGDGRGGRSALRRRQGAACGSARPTRPETAAEVVDAVYRLAGGAASGTSQPLSRCFRDVHVMTQHVMVGEQTLKPVGRILLGLETDTAQL